MNSGPSTVLVESRDNQRVALNAVRTTRELTHHYRLGNDVSRIIEWYVYKTFSEPVWNRDVRLLNPRRGPSRKAKRLGRARIHHLANNVLNKPLRIRGKIGK